jgi:hypothetical protein
LFRARTALPSQNIALLISLLLWDEAGYLRRAAPPVLK